MVIDYSQYKAWMKCPWYWYERYVNQVEKVWESGGYQDNALTFGSLVHAGLEGHSRKGDPIIPADLIQELNTSPDFTHLAQNMVLEYVRRYPAEEFEIHREEEPVEFSLCNPHFKWLEDKKGLAKIDRYFYNSTQRTLETGLEGFTMDIEPGWWIHEYKTKSAGVKRELWNRAWEMNMQANFQMLALREKVGEMPRGIIVQVLEKPRMHVPKRKCKGCGQLLEMATYILTTKVAAGPKDKTTGEVREVPLYSCMMCGFEQVLSPVKEEKVIHRPEFYRLRVTRTEKELACALAEIQTIAARMLNMEESGDGLLTHEPNRENCIHTFFGDCEFFNPHKNFLDLSQDEPGYAKRDAFAYIRASTENEMDL